MKINIEGLKIEYSVCGEGKDLILLHGWGANRNTFSMLTKRLKDKYKVYSIDLPGFGSSDILKPLGVDEVCDIVHEFVNIFGITNPIIIGHSYGGRIAIMYASRYSVKRLILVSTPAFKEKLSLYKRIKVWVYKLCKRFKISKYFGSKDYKEASDILKKTLVMTVNYDLTNELKIIQTPTLILAGKDDEVVPVNKMKKLKKYIKTSELIVMDNCKHFPYLERPVFFAMIVEAFLAEVDNV